MSKGKNIKPVPTKRAPSRVAASSPSPDKVDNKTPSPPGIKEIGGSGYYVWDMMMIDRVAATSPTFMADGENYTKKMAAIAMRAFKPADTVEGMLAAQAIALHHASLECSRRAILEGQPGEIASRLRKDAANSARAMVDMIEALDRRRGKGPQTIRVERVVVQDGGQAVVAGTVVSGAALAAQVPATGIVHGEDPMVLVEDEPVTVEGTGR